MSVTFFHTAEPIIGGWTLECGCGRGPEFADRSDAVKALEAWHETAQWDHCDDEICRAYAPFITPVYVGVEPLTVNLANQNARYILGVLGVFDPDLCGDMGVDEFAYALSEAVPGEGVETRVTVRVGGMTVELPESGVPSGSPVCMVHCGRDSGYDHRVLHELRELLDQARELHAERICWA